MINGLIRLAMANRLMVLVVVAALAGLAATTGICVGCEMWLFFARRRGVEVVA